MQKLEDLAGKRFADLDEMLKTVGFQGKEMERMVGAKQTYISFLIMNIISVKPHIRIRQKTEVEIKD